MTINRDSFYTAVSVLTTAVNVKPYPGVLNMLFELVHDCVGDVHVFEHSFQFWCELTATFRLTAHPAPPTVTVISQLVKGQHLKVKVKVSICIAHLAYTPPMRFSSLNRSASRTATACSLQTQAGAAPVSCTKFTTFRNPYKWVTTHSTVPQRVEGWVDL